MDRAKELFIAYSGNGYYMDLDGVRPEYESYHVPKEIEEQWRREYLDQFKEQKQTGKKTLRAYSQAVNFLKSDRRDEDWADFLYYPLRSPWLDDVTALFMLQHSGRLGEKFFRKGKLSREEISDYLKELDEFSKGILLRMENGTQSRHEDYTLGEFSDSEYTVGFLKDIRQKWTGLR